MNCEQEDNVIKYNGEAKKLFASPFFNCHAFVRSCQWQIPQMPKHAREVAGQKVFYKTAKHEEIYSMIVDERMVTYIRSLERPENPVIEEIEQEALDSYVPIIRKETQSFLKVMMLMNRPARVLEVGTAVGFSAILMSEYLPEDSHITTIENYEKRIPIARNNFKRAGKEEKITLIEGDALEVMKTLEGPYDFIFMDAAKGQYIHYMPEAVRLLSEGGILMSDNVLQDGDIIESRFAVERRNRTIHSRMREYLYELKHSDVLETSIIPLGDGVALSIKKKKEV